MSRPTSFLIILHRAPREDARLAEVLRTAAGVAPWGSVRLSMCLWGDARRQLLDHPHQVSVDRPAAWLEDLAAAGCLYAEAPAAPLSGKPPPGLRTTWIDRTALARLACASDIVWNLS